MRKKAILNSNTSGMRRHSRLYQFSRECARPFRFGICNAAGLSTHFSSCGVLASHRVHRIAGFMLTSASLTWCFHKAVDATPDAMGEADVGWGVECVPTHSNDIILQVLSLVLLLQLLPSLRLNGSADERKEEFEFV